MKKSTKRNLKLTSAVAALALIATGSLAYFTDYAETDAQGTAGTVGIELDSAINLLDADGKDILNPGDLRDAGFTVTNTGNKSIDVRTTIVLTSTQPMALSGQAEFELYHRDDVEFIDGKGWQPKGGASALEVREISADGLTITYKPADYILNGAGASDDVREIEADVAVDGKNFDVSDDGTSVAMDYVLVFKGASSNDFQAAGVSIDVLVEAKQHRNTEAGWELVAAQGEIVPAAN